jgi:hypothetical protein
MSKTETHFGKLRKVELSTTIEEFCSQKCNEIGITELPSYMDSWKEEFIDTFNQKFFITGDEVWEAIEHVEESDGDIDVMIPNEDGTITFVMQFYNGGTCLSEMIEDGLKRLKQVHNCNTQTESIN